MTRTIRDGLLGLSCLTLLAGCGERPHVAPGPLGLAYLCAGEPLTIVYGDGGYIPGATVRGANGAVPRSRAQLSFRGQQVDLVADDAFTDLRYVHDGADMHMVWIAQGESGQLERSGSAGAAPERLDCQRVRTVTPVAPAGAPALHPAA